MRYRIYAISYLFILVFYLISPIIPYIHYAVFKEYIAKNLCVRKNIPNSCCHGKCYLEKQVRNTKETGESEERNTNKKVQVRPLNEFLSSLNNHHDLFGIHLFHFVKTESINFQWFVSAIFVPPETESIL